MNTKNNANRKNSDKLIQNTVILGSSLLSFAIIASAVSNYVFPKQKTNYTQRERLVIEKFYLKIKQLENEMMESTDINHKFLKLGQCQCTLENMISMGLSEKDTNSIIQDNISAMKISFFNKYNMLKKQIDQQNAKMKT